MMLTVVLWPGQTAAQQETPGSWAKANLSPEEIRWLEEHPIIRMGVGTKFVPIMYVDESGSGAPVFTGMVSDYVRIISRRLGVKLEPVLGITFKEALAMGRRGEIDLYPCVAPSPSREDFLIHTKFYLSFPLVIITQDDTPYIGGLEDLSGKTLAVMKALATYGRVKRDYPNIKYRFVDSIPAALEAVSLGQADAYVINLAVAGHYIQSMGLTNLKVAAPTSYRNNNLAMGVRSDWPILASILNKTLDSISRQEKEKIRNKWLAVRYEHGIDWAMVFQVGGVGTLFLLSIIGVVLYWNQRLKNEVRERLEAEKQVLTLINALPDTVCFKDSEGRYLVANNRLLDLFGLDKNNDSMKGPSSLAEARESFKELLEYTMGTDEEAWEKGYLSTTDKSIRFADGSIKRFDIIKKATYHEDGSRKGLLVVGRDMTRIYHDRDELDQTKELLKTAMKQTPVGIIIADAPDVTMRLVNAEALRILGIPRGTANDAKADQPDRSWKIVRLDGTELPAEDYPLRKALRDGVPAFNQEKIVIGADGGKRHVLYNAAPVRGENGEFTAAVVVFSDITDLKEQELRRVQLESELLQSQKMEALGTLAGGIAHDFNNILNALMGYAELGLLKLSRGNSNEKEQHSIIDMALRGRDLVSQILTFSRKSEAALEIVRIDKVIPHAVSMLRRTLPRMISIKAELASDVCPIEGHPGQIEQVLMNLGSNAADAMPEGGRLTLGVENVELGQDRSDLGPEFKPGRYVRIRVRDNGVGMPREILDHIYEPFFTTKEVGKGTGLGLSTVFGIIRLHDGYLACNSEPGEGTTFDIFLPASSVLDPESPPVEAAPVMDLHGNETILLVDDEEALIEISGEILEGHGYKVLTAATGEEALAEFEKHPGEIDLVVLDISMPGMGGHKCMELILRINPDAKVIVASGYSTSGPLHQTMLEGASAYLIKPFSSKDLLRAIRDILNSED